MNLALVVVALVACAAVAAWVLWPLWRGVALLDPVDPRAVALLARRESILASLRDIDADHADGRLGDAAHAAMRGDLVRQGSAVLAALDSLEADSVSRTRDFLEDLEAEIAAIHGTPASRVGRDAGDDTDDTGAIRICGACGRRAVAGDAFCSKCGMVLGAGDGGS